MSLTMMLFAGLVLTWVGERIVETPNLRYALTATGVLLIVISCVTRLMRAKAVSGARAALERRFALFASLSLLALALYAVQSDLFTPLLGASLSAEYPKVAGIFAVLWPALMALAVLPTVLMELSFSTMAKAPTLESGRITEAMLSGVGLACALIFAFSLQYVATERDAKVDLSYFRVAKVGEATQKLVASLNEPLEVYLFFPPSSDAAEAVEGYFRDLAQASSLLHVTRLDHALEPAKAKALQVSGNGTVLLKKGEQRESLFIGTEVEKARTQLRGLDAEVQKRILKVGRAKRTVYLTRGHGERAAEPQNEQDQRATIELLTKTLADQNFDVRTLSTAEGLGQEVPSDASAVFIVGPTRPFSAPETAALSAYSEKGGRLFIAVDPESGLTFEELLKPLGLSFEPQPIAQQRNTANVKPPPGPADRINIGTRTFSSHPTVSNLGRNQVPVLFLGAGTLEELPAHPATLNLDFAVRSQPDSWADNNGNFEFDAQRGEVKKARGVMVAVERRGQNQSAEGAFRALVLGDSDAVGDVVLAQLLGNQYLLLDSMKWLLGEEQQIGLTQTELDVPLSRTRQQDLAWFYGTTFLAPLLVVGVGFAARRRSQKRSPLGVAS